MGTKYDFLLKTPLFQGIHEDALKPLLKSMHYSTKKYKKDELILHTGDTGRPLGIVLSGKVHIEKCDFWEIGPFWTVWEKVRSLLRPMPAILIFPLW